MGKFDQRKKFTKETRGNQLTREHVPRPQQIYHQENPELPGLVETSGSESDEDEVTPLTDTEAESGDEDLQQERHNTGATIGNFDPGGPKTDELHTTRHESDQAAVPTRDYLENLVQQVRTKHSINQVLPESTTSSNERLKTMVHNVQTKHFTRSTNNEATEDQGGTLLKKCKSPECDLAAKLQCPTCIKLNIQGSFFCTQACFKSNWNLHKNLHKMAKSNNTSQSSKDSDNEKIEELQKLVTYVKARHPWSSFENVLNAWPTNMECDANCSEQATPHTPEVAKQTAGYPGGSPQVDGSEADDESDEVQRELSGGRKTRVLIDRRTRGGKRSCNSNRLISNALKLIDVSSYLQNLNLGGDVVNVTRNETIGGFKLATR